VVILGTLVNHPERGLFWLVLASGAFWGQASCQAPPQGFRFLSYEVIIPRRMAPRRGREPQDLTYLLELEGKGHVVHLRQKRGFVPKHFPVFSYSRAGDLQVDYPFIRDDCFYHGFVQDKPSSLVSLSTCSGGLRGLLQIDGRIYEIEPAQTSATFQHVVFQLEQREDTVLMRCGLTEQGQSLQNSMVQKAEHVVAENVPSERDKWTHIRFAKLAMVVEHERYVKFGRNETLIAVQVLNIVHTTNSMYKPLSLQLSVVGLEIWSEKNLIEISESLEDTLSFFNTWRTNSLLKRLNNDASNLFVYKSFGSALGLAYVGGICDNRYGSAVESYRTSSLFHISNTFAHELGHVLGMRHDGQYCHCGTKACIMAAFQANIDKFSNCSYQQYFVKRNTPCLLVPPDPDKIYQLKYCGNQVVENGEQCDCGSKTQCESDLCCQSNCMLRPGAVCDTGQCCENCQYRSAQFICRKKTGNCDLPEYCNGTSGWCPEDVHVQDGAPCSDGAHCYHGKCTTLSGQCKMIFGGKATVGSEACFREVNTQGDRFGNCGRKHGTYSKCHMKNILCGRIQCENVHSIPSLEEHNTVVQTAIDNKQCWGIDYHSGVEIADIGAVKDGTPCGTDMMCIHGRCKNVSFLKYDCDVTKCHNRGICNSQKHCHCDYGWAPPDCLSKGYGGSIDSGPPPPQKRRTTFFRGAIIAVTVYFLTATVSI
uniref:ADAM metallopeptidase domain 21 n=1 Tax=Varanus komodoensis TaxID=61221 RepID=A0A8D2IYR6_VARKO